MGKSAGQRAYEGAMKFDGIGPHWWPAKWEALGAHERLRWETIAAGALTPEPESKSYGQIQYEAFTNASLGAPLDWGNYTCQEAAEAAAQAVLTEARKRGDL